MLLRDGEKVEVGFRQLKSLEAPVEKETVVGYVTYSVQGVIYRVEDIVVTESVDKITFRWCLEEVFERFVP
jgi:D-alanyl-D-alanine carboxypeptidase (penicillin-binding protein 5/6)